MNRRRSLSLLLGAVAVLLLAASSGAFSSAAAERGVSVAVAEDENAFIGYQATDRTVTDGEETTLVTVENRFTHPITVEEVDVDSELDIDHEAPEKQISAGASGEITGTVSCDGDGTESVDVSVTVDGAGVWAEISGETRRFEVTCKQPSDAASVNDVTTPGGSKIKIHTDQDRSVNATFLMVSDAGSDPTHSVSETKQVGTNTKLNRNNDLDLDGKFAAVKIDDGNTTVTYVRDDYDVDNRTLSDNGGKSWSEADSFDWDY